MSFIFDPKYFIYKYFLKKNEGTIHYKDILKYSFKNVFLVVYDGKHVNVFNM